MRAQLLARSLIAALTLACASAHASVHAAETGAPLDATLAVYERHGLIVLPWAGVGQFFFLAGSTPDSTRTLFSVSYLGVLSEGIDLELARGGTPVHWFRVHNTAVLQETITLAPGTYRLMVGGFVWPVVVPRLGSGSLATPIPMRHGNALPRSTAIVGGDSAIDLYVEAYGASPAPVTLSAPGWSDTVVLGRNGDLFSSTMHIPLARLGLGETTLIVARGRDSVTTPVFVGFASQTAVSFDQLVDALRYVAPSERLDSLRNAPLDKRPQAWATFVARYGQRLPEYFDRVREANRRYYNQGVPGWETDRGRVYVQLGDPDQMFVEPGVEIWMYTRYFGRLKFHLEAEHWRLMPEARDMLATLVARARSAR